MKINAINPNQVLNFNTNRTFSVLPKISCDSVSFSAKSNFKYQDAWYLKGKTIVEQDEYTTTVIDKPEKSGLLKRLKGTQPTRKIYDLPLRLRENLYKRRQDTFIEFLPPDVLSETGLRMDAFVREIDKVNTLISLVRPKYDIDENKTKQKFEMKMGDSIAQIERIKEGMSGTIYKIQIPKCRPLCLKHFINSDSANTQEGPFPEIAMATKLNKKFVQDVPIMFCANPYNGWMLSEYISPDYSSSVKGIKFDDFMKKNNLDCNDVNTGTIVHSNNGDIFVDFGYIAPSGSDRYTEGFDKVVLADKKEMVNSAGYVNFSKRSVLSLADNMFNYAEPKLKKMFFYELSRNPETKFYLAARRAVDNVLKNEPIEQSDKETLQKNYEELGFIGSAVKLIESCNQ